MDTELSIKLNNTLNGTSLKAIQDKEGNDIVDTYIKKEHYSSIDIGMIMYFAGNETIPVGFLLCNGASIRRDTYPDLFNIIGTRWGSVDNKHFNLPNLISRFAEGSINAGGYKEAGLPNITGASNVRDMRTGTSILTGGGAFVTSKANTSQPMDTSTSTGNYSTTFSFDASRSNPVYGNSNTVQPNSALLTPYIKAFAGASASSTDIEITKVANDIADKANMNLSNLSETGRKAFFPSGSYVTISAQSSTKDVETLTEYTPPANGYIHLYTQTISDSTNNGGGRIFYSQCATRSYALKSQITDCFLPVKKDIPVKIVAISSLVRSCVFIYAEGEKPV